MVEMQILDHEKENKGRYSVEKNKCFQRNIKVWAQWSDISLNIHNAKNQGRNWWWC